jgi:hypothetical protein
VIVIGKSAESKLIRRLVNGDGGLQMPPTGPLTDEEIGILRAWIDQGADFRIQVREAARARGSQALGISAWLRSARALQKDRRHSGAREGPTHWRDGAPPCGGFGDGDDETPPDRADPNAAIGANRRCSLGARRSQGPPALDAARCQHEPSTAGPPTGGSMANA